MRLKTPYRVASFIFSKNLSSFTEKFSKEGLFFPHFFYMMGAWKFAYAYFRCVTTPHHAQNRSPKCRLFRPSYPARPPLLSFFFSFYEDFCFGDTISKLSSTHVTRTSPVITIVLLKMLALFRTNRSELKTDAKTLISFIFSQQFLWFSLIRRKWVN